MFYGSIFFRFFGVLLRWIFLNIYNILLKRQKYNGYMYFWRLKNGKNLFSNASQELTDIIIGYLFVMALCALILFS
jgi:hypothetical protein